MSASAVDRRPRTSGAFTFALVLTTAAGILLGVLLRIPTAGFKGPPEDYLGFYGYIFDQPLGAYSDITALFFRDGLWHHPQPYVDYAPDYPVGTAWLVWLLNFVPGGVMPYFFATAGVLLVAALLLIRLIRSAPGAKPWLLALSPALPLYGVMNWDLVAILCAVSALALLSRGRESWAALLLGLGIWTKFFPVVLVPLAIADAAVRRRWWPVARMMGVLAVVSVVLNAPVALYSTSGGTQVRDSWLYFFRFNQERPRE